MDGGAEGTAGEAGLGPGGECPVCGVGLAGSAVGKGALGRLKDKCALPGCGQEGATGPEGSLYIDLQAAFHLPSASPEWDFSRVGNSRGKNTSSGGSAPPESNGAGPEKGGLQPAPRSLVSSTRARLHRGRQGGGSSQPPATLTTPGLSVFPGGLPSDPRPPRPLDTKVWRGGAKPVPRPRALGREV